MPAVVPAYFVGGPLAGLVLPGSSLAERILPATIAVQPQDEFWAITVPGADTGGGRKYILIPAGSAFATPWTYTLTGGNYV